MIVQSTSSQAVRRWLHVKEDRATAILPDMHLERFTKKGDEWENDHNGDKSVWLGEDRDGYCLTVMKERKRYYYSHEGQLSRITDRNGNSIWLRYAGKTLLEMAFPGGQSLKFSYEDGKVSMVEDIIGRRTCYRYDGELLTEVEYPNHGTVHYTYTPEGYLEQATDQNGYAYVHNYYDMDGRVNGERKGEVWQLSEYGIQRLIKCSFLRLLELYLSGGLDDFTIECRDRECPGEKDPELYGSIFWF